MTKAEQIAREEAIVRLREFFTPGSTVYTILRSVSRSGMSRHIGVKALFAPDRPGGSLITFDPNWLVAKATSFRINKDGDGLVVGGCGMDMGFHVAYNLSYALFPDGFECTGESCNSNDHSNGDRDYTPHHHRDGGYALRHRWL